uniref:Putative ovule protein n=1 Tax=Solanum chacoense TaxID=4108 RepID=A0A0V0GKY7_SOLCH
MKNVLDFEIWFTLIILFLILGKLSVLYGVLRGSIRLVTSKGYPWVVIATRRVTKWTTSLPKVPTC